MFSRRYVVISHFPRYILQDIDFLLPTLQNAMNWAKEIISKVNIISRKVRWNLNLIFDKFYCLQIKLRIRLLRRSFAWHLFQHLVLAKNSQSSFHIYPGDFWRSSMSRRYWDNIYRSRWRYFWSGAILHGFWHSKRTCLTYWNIFHMWTLHSQSWSRIF